ncbi:MAG: hypothetical protein Q8L55_04045 [Phycisphaerales bacterium]|nr:hypothetical protein [Phycisphaerales bacterium]
MALVGKAVRPNFRRALTIIEVVVALLFLVLIIGICLPALTRTGGRGSGYRQIKDGTMIRNVIQAMTIFAQDNKDTYPLPSMVDVNNQTLSIGTPGDSASQRGKDTSNHILSILIFNSSISPELLYSPAETNASIKIFSEYQNSNPQAAAVPANAVWDPALRCDFSTGAGHTSYAMLMPSGDTAAAADAPARGRLKSWSNTFNATEAVFGNRGPLITGKDAKGNPIYNKKSNTMAIHGGRTTWEGNIGYNDNHVNFETRMDPTEITYKRAGGGTHPDIFFYDEPDDADGLNTCLGIWVKAGMLPAEFKGVHD